MVASLLHGSATSQSSLGRHGLVGISRQYQVSVKIRLYLDQYPACLLSTCGRVVRALPYTVRVSPPEYVAAIGAFATVFITATQMTPFMIRILPLVDCFGPIWAGFSLNPNTKSWMKSIRRTSTMTPVRSSCSCARTNHDSDMLSLPVVAFQHTYYGGRICASVTRILSDSLFISSHRNFAGFRNALDTRSSMG